HDTFIYLNCIRILIPRGSAEAGQKFLRNGRKFTTPSNVL
ncbi:unnamed protein product, partial [marine sediment metagenome]